MDAQVLISIQSMIVVKDPYYNEPGYERRGNAHASTLYNRDMCANTLMHAILPALTKPPPEFAEVLRYVHLRCMQMLVCLCARTSRVYSQNPFATA